jgi:pimeloyl-ACP methyl ester carboxylesterase
MRVESQSVLIGHDRIEVRQWHPATLLDPTPIVLLHDSLGCISLWREFPAQLAQYLGRRVLAYDRSGFGHSSPRHERPGIDFIREEASAMPALWDALDLPRLVLLGHSVGGGMAVQAAAQHPLRVQAIITLSAQAFAEPLTLAGIRAAQRQFADPTQRERLARYHGERTDWVLDAWIGVWLDPAFRSWSLDAVLPAVHCPLLAIHGSADEYGSAEHPRRLTSLAGGKSSFRLLEGVGHAPHREQPHTVLSEVAAFLASSQSS